MTTLIAVLATAALFALAVFMPQKASGGASCSSGGCSTCGVDDCALTGVDTAAAAEVADRLRAKDDG